jgi:uncharacterized protein
MPNSTPAAVRITTSQARRLAIVGQRLAGPRPRATRAGILQVIHDIGYLQLDPTNVVARNPYLVLWSRIGRYDPSLLDALLAEHREVFETPSLLLPVSDLPLHAATMHAYRGMSASRGWGPSGRGKWSDLLVDWYARNAALRRRVLVRLRRDGPLPLTAFEDRESSSWTSGEWNSDRNVSLMLAILQRRGEVVVAGRTRGQKLWAVADGRLPKARPLPPKERARVATLRALDAMGLATMKQLGYGSKRTAEGWLGRGYYAFSRHITTDAFASLERDGRIVRVEVEDLPGIWFATSDVAERARAVRATWQPRTTLLSPFDNLIMDRDRVEQLFGYRYRIEIYTPVHLRTRGYWAMPVLHGDRIVGSVDPRVDRDRGELVVNRVVLEPGAPRSAMPAIRRAVAELAEFAGAATVRWPRGR